MARHFSLGSAWYMYSMKTLLSFLLFLNSYIRNEVPHTKKVQGEKNPIYIFFLVGNFDVGHAIIYEFVYVDDSRFLSYVRTLPFQNTAT